MVSLTWPGALAWRMRRQLLDPVGSTSTSGVVGTLGAVAAQLDPAAAELGIRTRRQTSRLGDVDRALEGRIIKTFAFRGRSSVEARGRGGLSRTASIEPHVGTFQLAELLRAHSGRLAGAP